MVTVSISSQVKVNAIHKITKNTINVPFKLTGGSHLGKLVNLESSERSLGSLCTKLL